MQHVFMDSHVYSQKEIKSVRIPRKEFLEMLPSISARRMDGEQGMDSPLWIGGKGLPAWETGPSYFFLLLSPPLTSDPQALSPGNVLEKQIPQLLPRPNDSNTPGWGPEICVLTSPLVNPDVLKFGNHCCSFAGLLFLSSITASFLHMANADIFTSLNFIFFKKSCSTCTQSAPG